MAAQLHWAPQPRLTCVGCKSCSTAEWSFLDQAQVQQINAAKVTRRYLSGDLLYTQGDACAGLHCIESGTIAVSQSAADGNSKMLRTIGAGQTVGYSDYFVGRVYRTSAHCLSQATVCLVPSAVLQQVLGVSPSLGLAFLAHCAEDLQNADVQGMQQALHSVRIRVVHLLLKFKDEYGVSDDDGGIIVSLPMSWQKAAELLGARAESVSRAVHALQEARVIRLEGRQVVIPDLDLLLDEVEQSGA